MSGLTIIVLGVTVVAFSVAFGAYLHWPQRSDPVCRSDLGIALMAGAFVAVAVFGLQLMVETRLQRVEKLRQVQVERQSLELQLALSTEPLPRISLRDRDLSYFYLFQKQFPGGIFDGSNLTGATLTQANLNSAHLNDATLERTHLDGAKLNSAQLMDAELKGADLTDAELKEAQLDGAKLNGTVLNGADLTDAHLNGVITSGMKRTDMAQTILIRADLTGADLRRVYFEAPTLTGAKFDSNTQFPAPYEARWTCDVGKICTIKEKGPILQ